MQSSEFELEGPLGTAILNKVDEKSYILCILENSKCLPRYIRFYTQNNEIVEEAFEEAKKIVGLEEWRVKLHEFVNGG